MTLPSTNRPRVLLRSSWQTANIGDVAHSPGALRAWTTFAPDAQLTLWPCHIDERERVMLSHAFPDVDIVDGEVDPDGKASTPELARAWEQADLLVHGPAAAVVAIDDFTAWRKTSGRPYGYFGVSIDPMAAFGGGTIAELATVVDALPAGHLDPQVLSLLSGAAFVYCRDSLSLAYARRQGVESPVLEWGADATFAFDLRDDGVADEILTAYGLAAGEFVCVVPRIRYAPYHRLRHYAPAPRDLLRDAVNAAHTPKDLGVLAEIITRVVRELGRSVLICPEMKHAVEIAHDDVIPRVPDDVRSRVHVLPHYWEAHHAAAVYARARAVVSMECHSPIIATGQGTPAIYLRLPTETVKGAMFADLGLDGTSVELDAGAADTVLSRLAGFDGDHPGAVRAARSAHARATATLRAMAERSLLALGDQRPGAVGSPW